MYDYSYNKFINTISHRIQKGSAHELSEGKLLIELTIDKISEKITEYFELPLRGEKKRDKLYLESYYERPKDLALLILNIIISSISKDGHIKILSLATRINNALHKDYIFTELKEQKPKLYSYIDREYTGRGSSYVEYKKLKLGKRMETLSEDMLSKNTLRVATLLIDLVLKSGCDIIEKKMIRNKKKTSSILVFTDNAFNIILKNREALLLTYRKYPIFVKPPTDWQGLDGHLGYYTEKLYTGTVIKTRGKNKQLLREYCKKKPLHKFLNIINHIQATKWQINKRVYEVINTVMKDNIIDLNTPKNNPMLLGGLPFNRLQIARDYIFEKDYPNNINRFYRVLTIQEGKIQITRSKAINQNLAMIDAKQYLNEPEIYFSYQADFRGRIYPVQQHLNPQATSSVKALLQFADGSKIENEEQLRWFKIYGANCYGWDKLSYDERVSNIEAIEESVKRVASNPMLYRDEWAYTDEPFLYLAWCFEYSDYLVNPSEFVSHIPIALDAVCSGIQIYSGLLKDREGAEAVNVIGGTRNDIYQKVADKVNEYLTKGEYNKEISFKQSDGSNNIVSTVAEADSLKGKITRRITKPNVMTVSYSVTRFGMYKQLIEVLNEYENENNVFWVGDKWVVARLLTELNEKAIREIVIGAKVGQEFLKEVSWEVTNKNDYIFFTTPFLEFPVLQRIFKVERERVATELGRLSIIHSTNDIADYKMANGVAPNFIHSLDSTLLLLIVESMSNNCNNFHLVHDSIGVPINQIESLNDTIREVFISLFEANPLLSFTKQVCPIMIDKAEEIMINTLDLNEVRDSKYIFC